MNDLRQLTLKKENTMSINTFIKENREEISQLIAEHYGENCRPTNDDDRRDWVLNDEGLYLWARSEGVRI